MVFFAVLPADVNREINTWLSGESSCVLEVLRRLSIVSSPVQGERMCLQVLWPISSLYQFGGGIYCMIGKLMGARWKFGRQCVKLHVVLTFTEEFLDLMYLSFILCIICCKVSLGYIFKLFLYEQKANRIQSIPQGTVLCSPARSVYFGGGWLLGMETVLSA